RKHKAFGPGQFTDDELVPTRLQCGNVVPCPLLQRSLTLDGINNDVGVQKAGHHGLPAGDVGLSGRAAVSFCSYASSASRRSTSISSALRPWNERACWDRWISSITSASPRTDGATGTACSVTQTRPG